MKLGVNLSFAVKRWIDPDQLAMIVKDDLGLDYVQYTWDLCDPWWPDEPRDRIVREYARAFRAADVGVESTCGGLASYTYNHFRAPTDELRALGFRHFARAIDMTAAMDVPITGMPFGSYSASDALNAARRTEIYKKALEAWVDLARYAAERGLSTLLVEPVPLGTEFPASAADALQLMRDLDGQTDIPVRLIVDWGHALYRPLFGDDATMEHWMETCGAYIHSYHIQQTDGQLDRHWSFTRDGMVTPRILQEYWKRFHLRQQTFFMEIIYPFEERDEVVLQDMIKAVRLLQA